MSIADFKKSYYSLFEKAAPETALLNYAGLRTLLSLILPIAKYKEIEYSYQLKRNQTVISIPTGFSINLKLFINGRLLLNGTHYTLDLTNNKITLIECFKFDTTLEIQEYANIQESRYDYILKATSTQLTLPSNFSLSKVRVFADGKLLSCNNHYSVDYTNKKIIFNEAYTKGTDISVLGGI